MNNTPSINPDDAGRRLPLALAAAEIGFYEWDIPANQFI